jgi:lipopolysaccharide/colanic/teichoic acid biosynthesis glycosyltransferase
MMKRVLDLVLLLLALPVVLPIFLATYIAVRLKLGSPVFFSQERGGYRGSRFRIWKFRSMTNARDASGWLLPDEDRLLPFGRLLRATSLDELPCLWNVVRGEMTIVGPRPLIADYLPLYTPEQYRRHSVKPGITGWAQVRGRNSISWEQKFALDIWYVDHRSIWLDLWIILLTFWSVVAMRGVSARGHATMPRFMGRSDKKGTLSDG